MNDVPNPKKEKSIYKSYWEKPAVKNVVEAMDLHDKRVCMACKFSGVQKQKTTKRLGSKETKYTGPPAGYVFDR